MILVEKFSGNRHYSCKKHTILASLSPLVFVLAFPTLVLLMEAALPLESVEFDLSVEDSGLPMLPGLPPLTIILADGLYVYTHR